MQYCPSHTRCCTLLFSWLWKYYEMFPPHHFFFKLKQILSSLQLFSRAENTIRNGLVSTRSSLLAKISDWGQKHVACAYIIVKCVTHTTTEELLGLVSSKINASNHSNSLKLNVNFSETKVDKAKRDWQLRNPDRQQDHPVKGCVETTNDRKFFLLCLSHWQFNIL